MGMFITLSNTVPDQHQVLTLLDTALTLLVLELWRVLIAGVKITQRINNVNVRITGGLSEKS